jgi:type IV pilus assembly protein PilQ
MRMSPVRILSNSAILISLMIACTGCAQRKLSVKEDSLAGGTPFATVQAIKVSEDASHVEISANNPLTYTSYKLDTPPKAVIDLSQTEPGGVTTPIEVNTGNIKRIEVGRHGFGESVFSRIEITLVKDEEFTVTTDPVDKGKLLVTFVKLPNNEKEVKAEGKIDEKQLKVEDLTPSTTAGTEVKPVEKQAEAKQAGTLAPAASPPPINPDNSQAKTEAKADAKASGKQQTKTLTAVSVVPDGVEIKVTGGVDKFNAFKLDKPFRLVLDVYGVKNGVSAKSLAIGTYGIGTARLGISPDKVRIVFDAVKDTLPPYQVVKSENGLKILFNGAVPTAPLKAVAVTAKEPTVKVAEGAKEPVRHNVENARPAKPKSSSVEAIDFKSAGEYSQISIKVAGDCKAEKPKKVAGGWALTIKNCQLPRRLQRMLDTSAFPSPVREITPYQVKVRGGYDAKVLVKLRNEVPFNFKQEGEVITWDIRNPEPRENQASPAETVKVPPSYPPAVALKTSELPPLEKELQSADKKKVYSGKRVTLEFSDSDIRKVLLLIESISEQNFIIDDGVSGTISLKLVNVPWDQALDVIMESRDLGRMQVGNVIYIKPKAKIKSQEDLEAEEKKAREKRMELKTRIFDVNFAAIGDVAGQFEKLKSERGAISLDARTNRVIVTDIEIRLEKMGNLLKELDMPEKQVMIEARIVEASSTFTRDLGVQWGIHYQDGSASFLGINNLDTGFGGLVTPPPTSGTSGPGGAIGMSFGKLTSNIQLDLRLSAAATAGLVKIISTPKVVTLNNKAAKISQGQNIPYQTTSAEGTKTEFVQAVLALEVTPHVTADGNIGLKIHASNNSAGSGSPPPINTKEATTELQVMNGETTVIGGIYVDSDTVTDTGVPFLMDIPLIGWLFKSNSKTKTKSELLIFITPRIVS